MKKSMLLQPRKNKYKKLKKRFLKNQLLETKTYKLKFGSFGIQVMESGRIKARQLESARQVINRALNRKGKVWIKVFPSISVTTKPSENRMGKGKGNVDFWVAVVKSGTVLFELSGTSEEKAIYSLNKAARKLPVKTKIIKC